jgi:geranylgeranyl pyrophosphate synthase
MNVEERLLLKKEAVEAELNRILPEGDSLLCEAIRYAVLSGGKRFRPLLALCSGESFDLSQEVILPFACAVELIHNYSLIHDDLPMMDDDDFRRGKPSCHRAFREDVALLAGDALLTLAFEIIASAPVGEQHFAGKERFMKEIAQNAGINGMVGGQLLDITLMPDSLTEELLLDLMERKTGALILTSVKVGPILAEAGSSELNRIVDYGRNLGMAFQIRDDILDFPETSPPSSPGRPNAAFFFGLDEAKARLKTHVRLSIEALDQSSLESEELRFLALQLLEIEK